MDKISVIVPVYNVERYLDRCIKSVVNQTYTNLEIILVDDGSTDSSGIICDRYGVSDNRILVIHKKNGGLSDARNYGLNAASGEYIGFVDADDWVDSNYFSLLHSYIISYKADVISCLFCRTDGSPKIKKSKKDIKINDLVGDKAMQYYMTSAIKGGATHISCCTKLYAKSIIGENRFVKGKCYEDLMFNWDIFNQGVRCVYCDYEGYFYYLNNNSITGGMFRESMYDLYFVAEYLKNKYIGNDVKVIKLLNQYEARVDYSILIKMLRSKYGSRQTQQMLLRKIKNNFWLLISSPLSMFRKMVLVAIMLIPCQKKI